MPLAIEDFAPIGLRKQGPIAAPDLAVPGTRPI